MKIPQEKLNELVKLIENEYGGWGEFLSILGTLFRARSMTLPNDNGGRMFNSIGKALKTYSKKNK